MLVTVVRSTRAKRLPVILNCLKELPDPYHLRIIGLTITADDEKVHKELEDQIAREGLMDRVQIDSCTQEELIPILQKAQVFLHASETSLDKAVLEAMACGCLVVSSAEAARAVLPDACLATDEIMAETVQALLQSDQSQLRTELRGRIEEEHSLKQLAERLVSEMNN